MIGNGDPGITRCSFERHAAQILDILNHTIVHSTALFDYEPRSAESMVDWFEHKARKGFPVLGLETGSGTLQGFATYGTFRDWPAYRYTVETSVYVRPGHRRQGVGRQLMQELIRAATDDGFHVLVAGIESTQHESIALHESLGFEFAGTICQAGFKFDRWLDLSFYQLLR